MINLLYKQTDEFYISITTFT